MMRKIWKYSLELKDGTQILQIPSDGKVVFVNDQQGTPTLWVEFYSKYVTLENRGFFIVGTGHEIPSAGTYIGSTMSGGFVWHVYELMGRDYDK